MREVSTRKQIGETLEELMGLEGVGLTVAKLQRHFDSLLRNVDRLKDEAEDLQERYDRGCSLCSDPNIEDPWRHDHDDSRGPHWHHRIDPGDGLVSECAFSDRLERVYQRALAGDVDAPDPWGDSS